MPLTPNVRPLRSLRYSCSNPPFFPLSYLLNARSQRRSTFAAGLKRVYGARVVNKGWKGFGTEGRQESF